MLQLVLELIGIGLGLAAAFFLLLNVLLGIEVLAALLLSDQHSAMEISGVLNVPESQSVFKVLVPAHNEASGIGFTLQNLLNEVSNPQQICVIADNCTDETAAIAREYNVQVLERTDTEMRGKGYALDFGLQHLEAKSDSPPDVVVMVDADCQVTAGTLAAIAERAAVNNRPVQAVYRMASPPNPSPKDGVSAFAFTVKNRVRAGGLSSLGMPILLGGTGMAFPWQALQQVEMASGHIVEDMKLGIDLAIAGYPPTLATDYVVTGQLPSSEEAATNQRTRWEHGHLESLTTYVPQLLSAAVKQRRMGLLVLALDLAIPPLSLWVTIGIGLAIATAIVATAAGMLWPAIVQLLACGVLVIAIGVAALKWRPAELSLMQLLRIPFYILWKLPIYLKFLVSPQKDWVRTERD
ncbi:MAG: glycosyltransferase family 2 protein [Cyanobacteria bacterium P01_E01_bin.34]